MRTLKTYCGKDHLLDEANTYINPTTGRRRCRACQRELKTTQRRTSGVREQDSTQCRNGHLYDEANTYLNPTTGDRLCKTCQRLHDEKRSGTPARQASWRRANIKRVFGITVEDYDRMLIEQGGRCAGCGSDTRGRGHFDIDHCHDTGRVRGLLCYQCNSALGFAEDSVDRLTDLIAYLMERAL